MDNKPHTVPALPSRLLEWYCGSSIEDLLGDLEELYFENLKTMSPFRAKWKYWKRALSLLFSYALRSRKRKAPLQSSAYNTALLLNHGKIAIRSLARQKTFTIINIVCLAVGMSVGLMALAALIDMGEVDDFHSGKENIYRVITSVDDKHDKEILASSSAPLAQQLTYEASGIEEIVQVKKDFYGEAVSDHDALSVSGYYVTENFLQVFNFPLEQGSIDLALSKPFSIVISKETSKKLFGEIDPIGKIIQIKELGDLVVTGVLKDYPRSHFLFKTLVSFSTLSVLEDQQKTNGLQDWGPRTNYYTYLLLSPGKSPEETKGILDTIVSNYFENQDELVVHADLQKLTDIPSSDYYNEIGPAWGYIPMLIFFSLALLVLLPACFNYSNISIARALRRAKEIGLRKVSGGQSDNIFLQMILETVVLSLIALAGGVLIFVLVRNEFLSMIVEGRRMFDFEITPFTLIVFVLFAIGTGILAGIFPALYFAKLNPIETLRNASLSGKLSKVNVRKGLIVFQFALSLVFILGVIIMARQYRYALNFDMGFQKENMLEVYMKGADYNSFKTRIEQLHDVKSISMSSSIPGSWGASQAWVQSTPDSDSIEVYQLFVDQNFLSCLEIPLLAGTNFPDKMPHEESFIIVNETFLRDYGIASMTEALDRTFIVDDKTLRIIGVVKDFNHMPLREQISSFFFRYDPSQLNVANIKLASHDITKTIAQIETYWEEVAPGHTMESYFLESKLDESLVSFRSMIKIFSFLGGLAITISCLGLLAVVISISESRIKEMGLRRVLGATSGNLALVLSRGFVKLIAIAIMIATPLAYFFFEKIFLRVQYYRASVTWIDLLLGILILMLLLVVTIGGQTLKVVRVNPVDTLKHE